MPREQLPVVFAAMQAGVSAKEIQVMVGAGSDSSHIAFCAVSNWRRAGLVQGVFSARATLVSCKGCGVSYNCVLCESSPRMMKCAKAQVALSLFAVSLAFLTVIVCEV